ncbi:MAG TPA: site-specific DNA-methyltransferase [Candidatus Baltobacteraceae bacterium]|jgi:adenine-specific DNA-methyltransferase|nr:site-specific DNA-methyltransferase [Candidatus Baltobacteraceae bacterium]
MPLLHWLTRDEDIHRVTHAPYRLLEEAAEHSHGDQDTGNMLIQGDNLDALKALLPYYAGKVKCIFIDPPYNTRSAFEQYDDNLEHTKWLSMMYPRMELLRDFLRRDGSIWISIDDNEAHYLKVVMDEIFGRSNFVANVLWQKRTSPDARLALGAAHDHILVYACDIGQLRMNKVQRDDRTTGFANPDDDPRGPWASTDFTAQGWRTNQMYPIKTRGGKTYDPPAGRCWANIEPEFLKLRSENRMWFGKSGNSRPRIKHFLSESLGITTWTWWTNKEVGHNQEAKIESKELFGAGDTFDTPKPERLLRRVIELASDSNELVLDSFLGSGTTAAVAHKLGRRYIGIENGEHAVTYCALRLCKVIEGEQGGISEAVGWKGGGGFRFYRLGDPVFDETGCIAQGIRFAPLAAHVWFVETGVPFSGQTDSPFLGTHEGTGYYLLFNGILGDKRPDGGNILTSHILATLPPFDGPKVIVGEGCRLSTERLQRERITFRHIPYEIKAR